MEFLFGVGCKALPSKLVSKHLFDTSEKAESIYLRMTLLIAPGISARKHASTNLRTRSAYICIYIHIYIYV